MPVIDYLEDNPDFALFYHDEANFTVNLSQNFAWVKKGACHDDERQKSGAGQGGVIFPIFSFSFSHSCAIGKGVGVSAFIDSTDCTILLRNSVANDPKALSGAIVKRQQKVKKSLEEEFDEADDQQGASKRSKSDKKSKSNQSSISVIDSAKDTSEKFLAILENAIDDAQKKYPGKIIVFVVDGGGPHTVEPSTSIRSSMMSMPEIRAELIRAEKLDKKEVLSLAKLRTRYIDSGICYDQWTTAELLCLEKGALILYLPLNHPAMNPIEQVWRAIKQEYRQYSDTKNLANMLDLITSAITMDGEYSDINSVENIKRRLDRTKMIRREVIANPKAGIPSENSLRKKGYKPFPKANANRLPSFIRKKKRDKLELALYFHYLNQTRLKQQRRGEVIIIDSRLFLTLTLLAVFEPG